MTTPVATAPDRAFPDQRTLLAWAFGARAVFAITILLLSATMWRDQQGRWPLVGAGVLVAALLARHILPTVKSKLCQENADIHAAG